MKRKQRDEHKTSTSNSGPHVTMDAEVEESLKSQGFWLIAPKSRICDLVSQEAVRAILDNAPSTPVYQSVLPNEDQVVLYKCDVLVSSQLPSVWYCSPNHPVYEMYGMDALKYNSGNLLRLATSPFVGVDSGMLYKKTKESGNSFSWHAEQMAFNSINVCVSRVGTISDSNQSFSYHLLLGEQVWRCVTQENRGLLIEAVYQTIISQHPSVFASINSGLLFFHAN